MAVGDTLRRLACKVALSTVKASLNDIFLPDQFGVGCRNGADAIIHSLATSMETLEEDECILQIDFNNAFNLVNRNKFMDLIGIHFPSLSNLVQYLYAAPSFLITGQDSEVIFSSQGVQQGCPLAPLLFALTLRELTRDLQKFDLSLNLWYLDDGHLVGKTHHLIQCLIRRRSTRAFTQSIQMRSLRDRVREIPNTDKEGSKRTCSIGGPSG